MFNTSTCAAEPIPPLHVRRPWWRTAIPVAFSVLMFGLFAYRVPDASGFAFPAMLLGVLLILLLHGGLLITREGLAWYILRPQWQYRFVPWSAVTDVRKPLLGMFGGIRLIVADGRYEPWVWGMPRDGGVREIDIRPNGYVGGQAIWDTIQQFWAARPHEQAAVKSENRCKS